MNIKATNLFSAVEVDVDLRSLIKVCRNNSDCWVDDHGDAVCSPFFYHTLTCPLVSLKQLLQLYVFTACHICLLSNNLQLIYKVVLVDTDLVFNFKSGIGTTPSSYQLDISATPDPAVDHAQSVQLTGTGADALLSKQGMAFKWSCGK